MKDFLIRSYAPEDEVAIVALWNDCSLVFPQNDPLKDIQRKIRVNPEWFLVGEIEGRIMSSCMAGYDGHRGNINYLGVHPDFQRNGYAEALMAEAERLLKEAGCPKINLCVRTTNTSVVEFYEGIGFSDNGCLSLGKRLIPDD